MKWDAMTSVPIPDVEFTEGTDYPCAVVRDANGNCLFITLFGRLGVEIDFNPKEPFQFTLVELARVAELLRRIAAGEPIKP